MKKQLEWIFDNSRLHKKAYITIYLLEVLSILEKVKNWTENRRKLEESTCFCTLRSLLDERSILSEQGSIFLENQLNDQAELSKQGEYFKNVVEQYWEIMPFYLGNRSNRKRKQQFRPEYTQSVPTLKWRINVYGLIPVQAWKKTQNW